MTSIQTAFDKLILRSPKLPGWIRRSNSGCKMRLGTNNAVLQGEHVSLSGGIRVVEGTGNKIDIRDHAHFKGRITIEGDGNTVILGPYSKFRGRISIRGDNQTVTLGEGSFSLGANIVCLEGCDVHIGRWCMLSRDVEIRTSDSHSIIDRATGTRVNLPGTVSIGDHVWVGAGVWIGKGGVVPDDCIVGAKSLVCGQFDQTGAIIAGVPASVRRTGVTWNHALKDQFSEEELTIWKESPPEEILRRT